jgi:amino acid permease
LAFDVCLSALSHLFSALTFAHSTPPRSSIDWKNPGPFAQLEAPDGTVVLGAWGRFLAFWTVMVNAAFSFIGTEVLAITAGEAANPRKTLPKAIKRTFWRVSKVELHPRSLAVVGS